MRLRDLDSVKLRSERDIINSWKIKSKNPIVSICCSVYNHEKYIEDAIKSFLMQKTNFKYEVLIHDDASTDKTAEIIKRYELVYPNIIKPFYAKENEYLKGFRRGSRIKRAKGKYIAICEGDDYWTDINKLQKQFDYMQKHPECSLCTHAVQRVNPEKTKKICEDRPYKESRVCKTQDIILGGGEFFGTSSLFYRKRLIKSPPQWYYDFPVGDYALQIYLALKGTVYYIDDFMSCYRWLVPGGWVFNQVFSVNSKKKKINYQMGLIKSFKQIRNTIDCSYKKTLNYAVLKSEWEIDFLNGHYCLMLSEKYLEILNNLSYIQKLKIRFGCYFPALYNLLFRLKEILVGKK
jgi:glycosyltransferase involved in cell wall biosynthesis